MQNLTVYKDSIGQGFALKSTVKTLADINGFNLAHKLGIHVYQLAKLIPSGDRLGVSSKLKRTSSSISAEFSEQIDTNDTDVIFTKRAKRINMQLKEMKSLLLLAHQSGYIENSVYLQLLKGYQKLALQFHERHKSEITRTLFD